MSEVGGDVVEPVGDVDGGVDDGLADDCGVGVADGHGVG